MRSFKGPKKQGGWIGAAIGAVGLIGGALISKKGAGDQNDRAVDEARQQQAFQERMSSTAYQRSSLDLEKAGLNRILALGSPASTPSGAAAPVVNELDGVASAAMQVGQNLNLAANTALQRKQTKTQAAQARNLNYSSDRMFSASELDQEKKHTERTQQGVNIMIARNQGHQAQLNSAKAAIANVERKVYESAGGTALKWAEKLGIKGPNVRVPFKR